MLIPNRMKGPLWLIACLICVTLGILMIFVLPPFNSTPFQALNNFMNLIIGSFMIFIGIGWLWGWIVTEEDRRAPDSSKIRRLRIRH